MDLAQSSTLQSHEGLLQIARAIADVLGDFQEESEPLVLTTVALDPLAVPSGACPKCLSVRGQIALACPACGLTFARFHVSLVAPSSALLEAFVVLQTQRSPLEAHARLLSRAQLCGELPQVVRLYRIVHARDPEDGCARAVLDEAVKLASAPMVVTVAAPVNRLLRNLVMVAVVAAFLATVAIHTASAL